MAKRIIVDALTKRREEMIEQSVLSSPISVSNTVETQSVVSNSEPVPPVEDQKQTVPIETEAAPVTTPAIDEIAAPEVNKIPEAGEIDGLGECDPGLVDSSMSLPDMSMEAIDKFGYGDMSPKACVSVSFKVDKFTYVWLSRVRWAYRQNGKAYTLGQIVLYMILSYTAKNFFHNRTLTSFQIKEDASLLRDRVADSKEAAKKLNWKEQSKRNTTLSVRYNSKVDYAIYYFKTLYTYYRNHFIYDAILDSLNSNFLQLRPKLKDFPEL